MSLKSDTDSEIRALLNGIIRDCSLSRQQICEKLTARLGQDITVFMLNDWTCEAKKRQRFPACFVQEFCEVIGDDSLHRYLAGPRLRRLIDFAERELSATKDEEERLRMRAELLHEDNER